MKKIIPNLLAEVDALVLLERIEEESVDLVYLDPPWNTTSSFGYKDTSNAKRNKEAYQEYMYKVLQQSYRVLKETGNLVVYSEPRVSLNLHPIITKVFGEQNYVQEFILPRRNMMHSHVSQTITTIICYRKSSEHIFNSLVKRPEEELKTLFPFSDQEGAYRTVDLTTNIDRGQPTTFTWQGYEPSPKRYWKYSKERLDEFLDAGKIEIKNDVPRLKQYVDENNGLYKKIYTVWDDIDLRGKKFSGYSFSQSESLLDRIIKITTNPGALVLDPFCGTGTSLVVASERGRYWIGGDNSSQAINIIKTRDLSDFKLWYEKDFLKIPAKWNNYDFLFQTTEEQIAELIAEGENRTIEFKESAAYNYRTGKSEKDSLSKNILQGVASFLNSESEGTLFIGVSDDKSLIDLSLHDYGTANRQKNNQDGYELFLTDKISKKLGIGARKYCEISFHRINDCDICRIQITPSNELVFLEEDFYIRNGNRKKKLTNKEFFEFLKYRFQLNIDNH